MLDTKLERVKQLIKVKEGAEAELAQLLGIADKPKRGRPRKEEQGEPVAGVQT